MQKLLSLFCFIILMSCQKEVHTKLLHGNYRATLKVQDNQLLPFNFKVKHDGTIEIYNAEEVIEVTDVRYSGDSISIHFPVYEGYIAGVFNNGQIKHAQYIKESLDRVVPVEFIHDSDERFLNVKTPITDVSGVWEMLFTEDEGSTFVAKGIFKQEGKKVTGTIRTTTGDYRYLEGVVDGNVLKYSVFDGAHAFLFTAEVDDNNMKNGVFYSGNHYKATYTAKRNTTYELPHEDTLTFLKEGYDSIEFSFPDTEGNMVSLNDERFKDKVVIVQVMGTWCPNCLDESKYYAEQYKTLKDKDVEFIALAFEYAKTQEKAFAGIKRLQNTVGIDYPILLAQYGSSDKGKANEKLPMLNHVLSYPTSIYVDKKGKVRKIHTGFNGPATGDKYLSFQKEFHEFVGELVNE